MVSSQQWMPRWDDRILLLLVESANGLRTWLEEFVVKICLWLDELWMMIYERIARLGKFFFFFGKVVRNAFISKPLYGEQYVHQFNRLRRGSTLYHILPELRSTKTLKIISKAQKFSTPTPTPTFPASWDDAPFVCLSVERIPKPFRARTQVTQRELKAS